MVLPGHLAGGYLATTALLAIFHPTLSIGQTNSLLIIGTLAGDLPDIDLIFFNFAHRKYQKSVAQNTLKIDSKIINSHRNYITHIPFFWFLISLIIVITGLIFNSIFTEYLGWTILTGTWSHLILDSIEYGILWLAPFSKKNYAIRENTPQGNTPYRQGSLIQHFHFIITTYWKIYTFWIEILISIIALIVLFKSF